MIGYCMFMSVEWMWGLSLGRVFFFLVFLYSAFEGKAPAFTIHLCMEDGLRILPPISYSGAV